MANREHHCCHGDHGRDHSEDKGFFGGLGDALTKGFEGMPTPFDLLDRLSGGSREEDDDDD